MKVCFKLCYFLLTKHYNMLQREGDRSRLLRAHVDLSDLINFHHTHSSQIKLIFNFFSFSSVFHVRLLHQLHYIKFQSHFSRSLFLLSCCFHFSVSLGTFSMHMQRIKLTKIFTKQLALFIRIFLHTRHSSLLSRPNPPTRML